jgi:hypothetical protein
MELFRIVLRVVVGLVIPGAVGLAVLMADAFTMHLK